MGLSYPQLWPISPLEYSNKLFSGAERKVSGIADHVGVTATID